MAAKLFQRRLLYLPSGIFFFWPVELWAESYINNLTRRIGRLALYVEAQAEDDSEDIHWVFGKSSGFIAKFPSSNTGRF